MDNLIAVSSWSLHRTIMQPTPLLEIPELLRNHGYSAMQLCHFHLPSRDGSYLAKFRAALRDAGVELITLLIDDRDITDPSAGAEAVEWISDWVRTAADLGAPRARVIAGKQAYSRESMDLAVVRLLQMAEVADEVGVTLEIENWHDLLSTPAAVHEILDRTQGAIRLNVDFGNWPKPFRYEGLPQIFRRAETCHAKFEFVSADELDRHDADRLLRIAIDADFKGPMVLVNGGIGESDWDAMDIQRAAILAAR